MNEEDAPGAVISRSRLEFLFDGVFAIAITLLVLELKVPALVDRHSVRELARALGHEAPTFASYVLSFVMLGVFWYRHNHQYRHFRFITRSMLVLHFVQLAAAAFFPFCAALFGRYPFNALSPVIYVGCVLTYIWASLGNWVIARRAGAIAESVSAEEYRRSRNRLLRGLAILSLFFLFYLLKVIAA